MILALLDRQQAGVAFEPALAGLLQTKERWSLVAQHKQA